MCKEHTNIYMDTLFFLFVPINNDCLFISWYYLDSGQLRVGNSQKHLRHLVEHQLHDQLLVFFNMFANQRHGAVHHLRTVAKQVSARHVGGASCPPPCATGCR